MFNMESRHLLNSRVQNALEYISDNFNLKNFRGLACARNSLEKCVVRSPDGRCRPHIIRPPLSQNPPSAPVVVVRLVPSRLSFHNPFMRMRTLVLDKPVWQEKTRLTSSMGLQGFLFSTSIKKKKEERKRRLCSGGYIFCTLLDR